MIDSDYDFHIGRTEYMDEPTGYREFIYLGIVALVVAAVIYGFGYLS